MVELNNDNFDDIVSKDKYVIVKFYTKWCVYCRKLAPEYEKLYELYQKKRNDVIIARIEGGANNIILARYGIYSFPIVALFAPGEKKIRQIYQGMRTVEMMDRWIEQIAPKVQIKPTANLTNSTTELKIEEIKDKTEMTEESEYVKREFIDIKKKMNDIEKFITQVNANLSMRSNLKKDKKEEGTKIVIEIDVSMFSVMITVIVLCVIISVIVTGKKLIYNIKFGAVHVKE